jgi:cytochrome c oxidase cbb3-type subunit 3
VPPSPRDGTLREHSYDGIQEYNKRLPNWWLLTFYGAIVFTIIYWFYYHHNHISLPDGERVTAELQQLEAIKMANATTYDDSALWKMSQNPVFTDAGRDTFNTNCATCHMTSLRGRDENPTAVGPNLADTKWLHGGAPTEVLHTVTVGVPDKGMQSWAPQIGAKRVAEVVSYVLSHHKENEPVEPDTTFHAAAQ